MASLNFTGWGGFLFSKEIVVVGFCRVACKKPQGVEHKLYQQQLSKEFVDCQKLLRRMSKETRGMKSKERRMSSLSKETRAADLFCSICDLQCDSLVNRISNIFETKYKNWHLRQLCMTCQIKCLFKVKFNAHVKGKPHAQKERESRFCRTCHLQLETKVNFEDPSLIFHNAF